ncbi:MAG: carboxypeptidase regulatory-like domain-containing protein [Gemmatimonadales bacterium]
MRLQPLVVVALLLLPRLASAQAPDTARRRPGVTVSGVVRDSIARMPLADAIVQLVAADRSADFIRTAVSDSLGRFTLTDVPGGRYALGFFHPVLDSLGVQAPLRDVYVDGQRPVHADLGIPSPARLRAAICGVRYASGSGALLVGVVRNARDGAPVAGVTVIGEWVELSLGRDGVLRRLAHLVATTGENGWFAMCNVPSAGTVALTASRGADSTDFIEVQVPAEGFLRRELYLGSARTVATGSTDQRADAAGQSSGRMHVGDGRLSGTVVTAAEGRPLAGAQVSITDGPQTRANERGEWTLVDAPVGTRMLEIRALGYYPERRHVHVIPGAEPVRVALSTLKAVLDTVKVRATRFYNRDRSGFQERRHVGVGRYLTPADIARRPATFTSDLFRTVSGVRIGFASDTLMSDMVLAVSPDDMSTTDRRILMKGISGDWCAPAIYMDGLHMPGFDADAIDAWVRPRDVSGIEIYSEASVPSEFQQKRSGCGSIVIWRK